MSVEEWKTLESETTRLLTNLHKDPVGRREDTKVTNRKLLQFNDIVKKRDSLIQTFNQSRQNSDKVQLVKQILKNINRQLNEIKFIIDSRINVGIMGEKFDIKTASSLIPVMDGSESKTKRIIQAIEFYSELLDDAGKKLLIKYVLKTCISEFAIIRLEDDYATVAELIKDLKCNCLTPKQASVLFGQLYTSNQGNKSIDDYGRDLEALMVELTLSQSKGDVNTQKILRPINESIVTQIFIEGLQSQELKTILKAQNCEILSKAIEVAKKNCPQSSKIENAYFANANGFRRGYRSNSYVTTKPREQQNYKSHLNYNKNKIHDGNDFYSKDRSGTSFNNKNMRYQRQNYTSFQKPTEQSFSRQVKSAESNERPSFQRKQSRQFFRGSQ